MPILAAELIAAERLSAAAAAVQIQSVDYAKLVTVDFSKLFAEIASTATSAVVSAAQVGYEPRYFPPPLVQEKHVHIVINLIVDTPSQR